MSKGILQVHPPICDCPGCRISSPVNRGRLAEKRTIPLPPTRIPKKELSSIFSASDGDSDGSSPAHGHRPDVKQEDDVHISIMKRSRDSDLSTIISNLHQSRHLVMPERQSRCEFQRSSVEIGLGPAGEGGAAPEVRGCGSEWSWREEPSPSPLREEPAPQMTPEEHYRRMMSALSEPARWACHRVRVPSSPPGYGFLQPAQAEMFARQQEILQMSLARGPPPSSTQDVMKWGPSQPEASEQPLRVKSEGPPWSRRGRSVLAQSGAPLALPPSAPPLKGVGRPGEAKEAPGPGVRTQDSPENNDSKESDSEEAEAPRAEVGGASRTCDGPKDAPGAPSGESPGHGLGGRAEGKGPLLGAPLPPPLPLSLPYAVSPYFHTGSGEEAVGPEDVSKWTVDDVCTFVGGLAGCGEYASVFREQAIDGETLPLLTEEHLLTNMGLKLGPALKIRSHVAKRVGRLFYMASFPVALPLQAPGLRGAADRELPAELQPSSPAHAASPFGGGFSASRSSPKQENGAPSLLVGMGDVPKPPS
uniref:SAM domain-containing protein n=1 Tax=Sarcophilus harrisii TaxID=9305 RepID=A0A7N4PDF7_SARHA